MVGLIFFILYVVLLCVLGMIVRWEYLRFIVKRGAH